MKKALFIDRDGTIIVEPTDNFQIDSLQKLEFVPKVIVSLYKIAQETDFELVMVTNQDGLGTSSFPEHDFVPPHEKMLKTLKNEGITFAKVHIDKSFEHENTPTRKPQIGMLLDYQNGNYDLHNSFVIGDRITDVQLAENLGTKSILYGTKNDQRAHLCTTDWEEIYRFLKLQTNRTAQTHRITNETDVLVALNLNGSGQAKISTKIGFFDHLLEQIAKHSGIDLTIEATGDLHIEAHHTIEDVALAFGETFLKALGDKRGIARYGHFMLPMDESLAQVALDFSGRPFLVWQANLKREQIGEMPTEMVEHFFKSFADTAKCNLNIDIKGQNDHHQIEAAFKAFAKAIKMAIAKQGNALPTTKGML